MSRAPITHLPYHLSVHIQGQQVTHLINPKTVFDPLSTTLTRSGGTTGLIMTATSAVPVFTALVSDTPIITHVPGPHGLPGGYPVTVNNTGVSLALPNDISHDQAIKLNWQGLRHDGIEKIDAQGTVFFAQEPMSPYKKILGYDCLSMSLNDVEDRAHELAQRIERVT